MTRRVLSVLAFFLATVTFVHAQQPQIETTLQTFADQPLPVKVVEGTLRNFQFTSELTATIAFLPEAKVQSAEFYLVVYHGGHAVAGEGWVEPNPSASISRQTKLALAEGDSAILLVDSVVTPTRTFKLSKSDISDNLLHMIHSETFLPAPVQISMLQLPGASLHRVQGDFCTAAVAAAVQVCGSGQVQSVTCNAQQNSFSFSCKTNTKLNPTPPSN